MSEAESSDSGAPAEPDEPSAASAPAGGVFADPWFRFAATFGVLALACEVLYYAVLVDSAPLQRYLLGLTWMAATLLEIAQVEIEVSRTMITSAGFSVQIAHGCDAIQICALLSCAVLAFPVSKRAKLVGLVLGILWLQALNQLRIVSLLLIGRHYMSVFETAHLTVWPTFLIVITVVTWIVWVRWATRDEVVDAEPAA